MTPSGTVSGDMYLLLWSEYLSNSNYGYKNLCLVTSNSIYNSSFSGAVFNSMFERLKIEVHSCFYHTILGYLFVHSKATFIQIWELLMNEYASSVTTNSFWLEIRPESPSNLAAWQRPLTNNIRIKATGVIFAFSFHARMDRFSVRETHTSLNFFLFVCIPLVGKNNIRNWRFIYWLRNRYA